MKKVNILLDDDTFDRLKAVTFALDKSPTELLKPYIERIIRDNAETVKKKLLFTADQFTDADKTVEEHLMPKNQQVTNAEKQQLDDADADTLRQKATQFKDLIATAKNGQRYLLKKQKTTINGLDTKYPVFADGKQHPAYLLPADLQEAPESPTSDGNKS